MRASAQSSLPVESGTVLGLDFSEDGSMAKPLQGKEYRERIGFVRQQDFLVEHLTGKS
jgi:hypothetical protein